jgi:chemotaxis protein MotB
MRSRLADAGESEEVENSERWLLTYADMITLLLALFIVLFAVSTISTKKFEALALGLQKSFSPNPGVLPSSNGVEQYDSLTPTAGPRQIQQTPSVNTPAKQAAATASATSLSASAESQLAAVDQKITQAIAAKGLQGTAGVTEAIESRGLVVQVLTDKVFFASDSADLGPAGEEVVDTIASVLRSTTNGIDVEGYTDDEPITGGPYTTNEELSAVRAASVVTRLVDVDGLDPDRLAATGFGASHAVAPNDTPADRALNRRIDFVILASGATQP